MKIVGISGKKQAGKNTVCNFLFGQYLVQNNIVDKYHIDASTGELNIEKDIEHPYLIYSFADYLKQICIQVFGLTEEMVYGTDEQKNQPTHIKWDDMPLFTQGDVGQVRANSSYPLKTTVSGYMTAREFMQILGTDVFRRIWEPVWVESLFKRLEIEQPPVALICDVRFPNEVKKIEENGGLVIRLTRNPFEDNSTGEIILDSYPFQYVVDNKDMDIPTQNYEVFKIVKDYLFS